MGRKNHINGEYNEKLASHETLQRRKMISVDLRSNSISISRQLPQSGIRIELDTEPVDHNDISHTRKPTFVRRTEECGVRRVSYSLKAL
jgi:hypothetical protein